MGNIWRKLFNDFSPRSRAGIVEFMANETGITDHEQLTKVYEESNPLFVVETKAGEMLINVDSGSLDRLGEAFKNIMQ